MASATNAAVNADDGVCAALFAEANVAIANRFIDGGFESRVVGFKFSEFTLEAGFLVDKRSAGEFDIFHFSGGDFGNLGGFAIGDIDLFHEDKLFVVQLGNGLFAELDFMGESPVFLVLFGLELLQRIFFDKTFFRFDFEFEFLAIGLKLFGFLFASFGLGLSTLGALVESGAFRAEVGEFGLDAHDFSVAVLKDEQVFDYREHLVACG